GNGDIWEADDAVQMVAHTGCDGVVVGRGCLGRPWLFADLEAAFTGRADRGLPSLGQVAATVRHHADLLVRMYGDDRAGPTDLRKFMAWYLKGYPVGSELRQALAQVSGAMELDDLLGKLDPDAPFPTETLGQPRGRTNSPGRVALPDGWLRDRDELAVPVDA